MKREIGRTREEADKTEITSNETAEQRQRQVRKFFSVIHPNKFQQSN